MMPVLTTLSSPYAEIKIEAASSEASQAILARIHEALIELERSGL